MWQRLHRKMHALAKRLGGDERGVAAIEFALIAGMLCVVGMNAADIAMYTYKRMEVADAAHSGAIAGWKACDLQSLPATENCPGFSAAVTAGIQSTSLGDSVTLSSGSPSEGYYCLNASNALEYVSDVDNKPSDCSGSGNPGLSPADYITVDVTYHYTPVFADLSVASFFSTPIQSSALVRME